ncbi:molybdenum cofactor sulfurase-like [Momordica charantia]|uniref:Molybdenum cofactor sulfurase-like n=1 Tax=Momordica charantia TaxID=3673 RepID=A0A6J1DYX9_MOMCH|nr:molybdenum cofactor sulfurase-like [Momordica charantia]
MSVAQENRWHVLVDACALGPKDMDCFGLSLFRPDFVVCSFYKVFGDNPSGFGCLLVKKSVVPILEEGDSSSSSGVGIVSLVPAEPSTSSFSGRISEVEAEESKCRGLDQVDSLGLVLISTRARCLINWLVSSLMKLKHPNTEEGVNLVKIYGPKVRFDRGPALAFNVFDWKGEKVEPVLVQKLADRSNISLTYGFLHNIWFSEKYAEEKGRVLERRHSCGGGDDDDDDGGKKKKKKKKKNKSKGRGNLGISVVTAALGFLTNFEDAYKLWAFVAQFLDADFVEKERWRYTALNQRTIVEVL